MVSFFWHKGFYFNRRLYFFEQFFIKDFSKLYSLSDRFLLLWRYRCEGFSNDTPANIRQPLSPVINGSLLSYKYRLYPLSGFSTTQLFLLNVYLLRTWPVILNFKHQLRFNMWFHFLNKTYRGLSLKIGKPLRKRTRGRTYHKKSKSNKYRDYISKSKWFA